MQALKVKELLYQFVMYLNNDICFFIYIYIYICYLGKGSKTKESHTQLQRRSNWSKRKQHQSPTMEQE